MVLFRRVVSGKLETQLVEGEFYPKAYPNATGDNARFNAPNAYKVIAVSRPGWRREDGNRRRLELRGRRDHDLSLRPEEG
jgi:hypothetical protein